MTFLTDMILLMTLTTTTILYSGDNVSALCALPFLALAIMPYIFRAMLDGIGLDTAFLVLLFFCFLTTGALTMHLERNGVDMELRSPQAGNVTWTRTEGFQRRPGMAVGMQKGEMRTKGVEMEAQKEGASW